MFVISNLHIPLLIFSLFNFTYNQETIKNEPWKQDIQILLGFSGSEIDGVMGKETFQLLKKFALAGN